LLSISALRKNADLSILKEAIDDLKRGKQSISYITAKNTSYWAN